MTSWANPASVKVVFSSYLGDDLNFYSFDSMFIICGRKGIVRVEIVCPVMGLGLCVNGTN